MRRRHRAAVLALALVATTASIAGAASEPAPDAAEGRRIFSQNCARCHGFDMMNPAPGIFDLRTFPPEDKARFLAAVSTGKGAMPGWKDVLNPADLEALWSYISAARNP